MRYLASFALVCFATAALAEDLFPPPWRGEPNTTFQHWTFDTDQSTGGGGTGQWIPEVADNPYGQPYIDTFWGDETWLPDYEGRSGVMRMWAGIAYINLPNVPDPDDWKIVWLQSTWSGDPVMWTFSDPPAADIFDLGTIDLGDGWFHTTYEIWIPGNPPFETIGLNNSNGTTYFDQIVVDTICIPEPASLLLLGFAAVLLRRR